MRDGTGTVDDAGMVPIADQHMCGDSHFAEKVERRGVGEKQISLVKHRGDGTANLYVSLRPAVWHPGSEAQVDQPIAISRPVESVELRDDWLSAHYDGEFD